MSGNHRERPGEDDGAGGDARDDAAGVAERGVPCANSGWAAACSLRGHVDERAPEP
jgi:hypothetical protein